MCFSYSMFSVFSQYSRSYSVSFTFSTFLSVSRHIPGQIVFVSHFQHFSVFFFAIFLVLQCVFLIFNVFQSFSTYFMSYSLCFSFSMIFSFLVILQNLKCPFLVITFFQCIFPIYQVRKCVFTIFHDFQFYCRTSCPTMCISHFLRF